MPRGIKNKATAKKTKNAKAPAKRPAAKVAKVEKKMPFYSQLGRLLAAMKDRTAPRGLYAQVIFPKLEANAMPGDDIAGANQGISHLKIRVGNEKAAVYEGDLKDFIHRLLGAVGTSLKIDQDNDPIPDPSGERAGIAAAG